MKEIFHRTSIRKYKKEPVEKAKIEKMLKKTHWHNAFALVDLSLDIWQFVPVVFCDKTGGNGNEES